MGVDFDLRGFMEDMRACKPPYKCPRCSKIYKTFSGMSFHLQTHESEDKAALSKAGDSDGLPARPFFGSPHKESLSYSASRGVLEFEAGGRSEVLNVSKELKLLSRSDWEASLPKEPFSEPEKTLPETPNGSLKRGKKSKTEEENSESEKKHLIKLPEAQFTVMSDYFLPDKDPFVLGGEYYEFREKSPPTLDAEVEYDMDEEDVAWLDLINRKRISDNLTGVTETEFELLMDRLEKESYFHVQSNGSGDFETPVDDDAICCVCMDGECSNTNVILFCDLCNLAVHQECYGVPYIPEGQWLCRRCLQSPSRSVECCLCPNRGGAFKQTDDGRWAHVVCGLWIPEVRFANTVFLEPIDSIDNIPPARWKLSCRVCKQRGAGACIQCHKTNCYTAFHVTCGLLAGLHMKMDTVRESSASGLSVTVRKTAYCDVHTPLDSDCKPKLEDVAALGICTPKFKGRSPKKGPGESSPLPVLFRGLMNFNPQCPWEKVQEIASLINVQRKNQFFQRLMAYWTLKRQIRNGVPLIRRLQFAKASTANKNADSPRKTDASSPHLDDEDDERHFLKKTPKPRRKKTPSAKKEFKAMMEQRKLLRRLRQDLERVRLLCELIRKREQRKRELISLDFEKSQLILLPNLPELRSIFKSLEDLDKNGFFAEPVSVIDVPDYLDHIKHPMDFSTMKSKLESFSYCSIKDIEKDYTLMIDNCLSYNEKETVFYRAGIKMKEQGALIFRKAKRQSSIPTPNVEEALPVPLPKPSKKKSLINDAAVMKEVDDLLEADDLKENDPHLFLEKLLSLADRAALLSHPVAKTRRVKLLKTEIYNTRKRIAMEKEVGPPGNRRRGADKRQPKSIATDEFVSETPRVLRTTVKDDATPNPKKRGRKRIIRSSPDTPSAESPVTKKSKRDVKNPSPDEDKNLVSKASPLGVNRRNAVLFTRKKQSANSTPTTPANHSSNQDQEDEVIVSKPTEDTPKRRGRKPKAIFQAQNDSPPKDKTSVPLKVIKPCLTNNSLNSASFRVYRRGGGELGETDESESQTDGGGLTTEDDSTEETESEEDSDDSSEQRIGRHEDMVLEPLDLVWAKTRGYPWYPALIIDPKMPRTGYLHNGVPIPVPPDDVLEMASSHLSPHFLILFFDSKRTWQWLERDKLEPLGVDSNLDKAKLVGSKKPSERKAVKKAYEDAIHHRCKVTGEEDIALSEADSETERNS